jgi:hypothetical protein
VVVPRSTDWHLIDGVDVRIKKHKGDQMGKGYTRRLRRNDHGVCLVKALVALFRGSPSVAAAEPALSYASRSGIGAVNRSDISGAIKAAAASLGEDPNDFGTHSLRIGCATAMADLGLQDGFIMWFGDWQSPSYRSYCRATTDRTETTSTSC